MPVRRERERLLATFAMLVLLLPSWAACADRPATAASRLEIPAQDLAAALGRFSELTGMAVLVDRQLTEGRRSSRVTGGMLPRLALAQLLAGSGLMAVYAGAEGFTVQTARVLSPGQGSLRSASASRSFATEVQQGVLAALCGAELTRPGNYRAVLQLWVGRLGKVEYSWLVDTTGDYGRDEALIKLLGQIVIQRPPPSSMPQPVTILLEPAVSGKSMDCHESKGGAYQ